MFQKYENAEILKDIFIVVWSGSANTVTYQKCRNWSFSHSELITELTHAQEKKMPSIKALDKKKSKLI